MQVPEQPVGPWRRADDLRNPVIVTGIPRTGVRLLAAILDGHPALASGPDLPVVATLVQQWQEIHSSLGAHLERNHRVAPADSRAAFREAVLKLFVPRLESTGKQRFVFHSFTVLPLLDRFTTLFPEARFILAIRDPRTVAGSLLRCDWRDTRTGEALACTRDAVMAARFIVQHMATVLQEKAAALQADGRLMVLRYETLCADPAGSMARTAAFLDADIPHPFVSQASAELVTRSRDNPHPPLRPGSVDTNSLEVRNLPDLGPMSEPIEKLRRSLGYAQPCR